MTAAANRSGSSSQGSGRAPGWTTRLALAEQRGELGRHRGRPLQVDLAADDQHRRAEAAAPARAAAGSNAPSAPKAAAAAHSSAPARRHRAPGRRRPSGRRRTGPSPPSPPPIPGRRYPLVRGGRVREPRLGTATLDDLAPHRGVRFQADGAAARRDQQQPAHPVRMAQRVLQGDVGPGRVSEHVGAGQAEVILQGEDVVGQPVAAVAGRIGRDGRAAGAAQVEQDQPTVRGQAAEIAQARGRPHRPAGQADQRGAVAVSVDVVGQFGSVEGAEGRHGGDVRSRGERRKRILVREGLGWGREELRWSRFRRSR